MSEEWKGKEFSLFLLFTFHSSLCTETFEKSKDPSWHSGHGFLPSVEMGINIGKVLLNLR